MDGKVDRSEWRPPFEGFATDAIHVGQEPEQWNCRMLVPPVVTAATYKQLGPGEHGGYQYGRYVNPTRSCLQKCVAALEGGKYAFAFSSGLAATMTVINLLKAGDHIIAQDDMYGGASRQFDNVSVKFGLEFSYVDFTNPENIKSNMKPNTTLVWAETPSNPTMKVTDIAAVSEITKQKEDCLLLVDNTFMSPYFQRPLELGADISYQSATKYINGHSDVLLGMLVVNDEKLRDRIHFLQYTTGPVASPFDCYLTNRGVKTLALRMEKHQENATKIANFLEKHPLVERVKYAGSPSHPQHDIMKKQASGCSGMLCFWIKADLQQTKNFFKHLKLITLAESLGGYDSLIEHPRTMTHATVPLERREQLEISDNLVRMSVGLEDAKNLIQDLDQALKASLG